VVKISLEEYRQRVTISDPQALFYVAWDYFKGRLVPRDLPMAIALLRQLEEKSPELARFNIAKMKYLVGDDSLRDDIKADCDAGFGPALYLMAAHSYKNRGETGSREAIRYFRAAAQNGHLISKIWLLRLSKPGFWGRLQTAIPMYWTGLQFVVIKIRNCDDVRVWL
jgi:TPR repeat protein